MGVTRRRLLQTAATSPLWTSLLEAATLARYPCLQNVSATQASVLWTTRESGEGRAVVSAIPNLQNARQVRAQSRTYLPAETGMSSPFTLHQADFTGLQPDTVYYYSIYLGNDNLTPFLDGFVPFRTAQRPGTAFRFLAIGDSGLSSVEQGLIALRMEREEGVGFVIHVGDIVYPDATFADFETNHFRYYRNLMPSVAFFPCLGNHDISADGGKSYLANHVLPASGVTDPDAGRYYSYDWADAHFVALDSNIMAAPAPSQRMLDWLEADLAKTRKAWKIVFFHHTPYDAKRGQDPEQVAIRQRLLPILDRHGVQLVLAGHHHSYQRSVPVAAGQRVDAGRGIVYVTTGGAGALLYSENDHPLNAVGLMEYHYMRFDIRGSELTGIALRPDGREIDRFTLQPKPAVRPEGVVNGATFTRTLGVGGIVSIFGQNLAFQEESYRQLPLPRELGQVRVTLNNRDLPIYFVSPGQINAQLPYDVTGNATLKVVVAPGDQREAAVNVTIGEAAPGILTTQSGLGAIVKQNGSLISPVNPATPGETLTIYAAGLGSVNGTIREGEATPRSPLLHTSAQVMVRLGNLAVRPAFAGLAPTYVGLYQVNVEIPAETEPGTISISLRVGALGSNQVPLPVA